MAFPTNLDLRSLRYVVAIAEHRSLARAAAELNVTQPALSRSIQALERTLAVKLFDRGRAGARPTVFGKLLVERGRALLADARAIERDIRLLSGTEVGELRIGAGPYPAEISVGRAAAMLISRHPALKIRIVVGDWPTLTHRVLAEELDLAICETTMAEESGRLVTEPLPIHQGHLFCRSGHPLAKKTPLTLGALASFPIALTTLPGRVAYLAHMRPEQTAGRLAPEVHVDTFDLARQIVLGSDAIGAAVASQLSDDVKAGQLVTLPIDLPSLATHYGFIHLAGRLLSPSAESFMTIVRELEAEVDASEDIR